MKRLTIVVTLVSLVTSLGASGLPVQNESKQPPPIAASAIEPVKYIGTEQPDPYSYDGRLRHAVGVHSIQVYRANRSLPFEGTPVGFTYNHQPYLAFWNGQFYLQFLSGQVQEHTPPTRLMLVTSPDGQVWSDPAILFPEYTLPEINTGDGIIPAGTKSVMHQRMGFYVAPNGVLLTSGFYSYCATPRHSPNKGQGIGRVVREINRDGSFGPIYFIRYNRHAGFDETNTSFPFFRESRQSRFLKACEALLADPLVTLQWWEEDRGTDGFFVIDPSKVLGDDATASMKGVTTSAGAGKAFDFFHRLDGIIVGLWKNQYSSLSADEGRHWTPVAKNQTLKTCGAKTWGQRTDDGQFALAYDHSATRRNRFPLVVVTGADGYTFDNMLCVQGEVPPIRFQGIHKNPGPQYVRGIMEGNGNPPGDEMWLAYSMNKEDIWVSRVRVPVRGTAAKQVDQDFEQAVSVADLTLWNLYMPRWAPISVEHAADTSNHFLVLRDEAPYDRARAERAFPPGRNITVRFRILMAEVTQGHALEVEVQDRYGTRPMRLRFEREWLGLDRADVFPLKPIRISQGRWYNIQLNFDCEAQSYDLAIDGKWLRSSIKFAEPVSGLERLVFRTGPYRGEVPKTLAEKGEPKPAGLYHEDAPGADTKAELTSFWIDDVSTSAWQP